MLKKSLIALALVGAAASVQAATYTPDTLLDSGLQGVAGGPASSGAADELAWMEAATGVSGLTLSKSNCGTDPGEVDCDVTVQKDEAGSWFIDIAPYTTGYFMLKFGVGQTGSDTHYAFANIAEMSKLVWTNEQTQGLGGTGDTIGRLSHYSVTGLTEVPVPGTLGLLGLGFVGLGLVRRKQQV